MISRRSEMAMYRQNVQSDVPKTKKRRKMYLQP